MAPSAEEQKQAVDLSGTILGDFHLEKKLGQGGMGQVYLGEQVSLKRKVAIKVMRSDVTLSATALARFRSEAQAVARLTHVNIVQVYTIAEHAGMHYIALEFVEGASLGQYMARKGALPVNVTLTILKQVAAALAHAGEAGIVHRDIKPENILITRKADAKVTDFGLARCTDDSEGQVNLTQSGVVVGTPVYMSPEQVQGKKADCRTDIYSLGVTAYHMLAGQPPFKGETAFELALQHVQSEAPPLGKHRADVPKELEHIIQRMMAKNPDDRFASGKELLRALNQVAVGENGDRRAMEVDTGVSSRGVRRNSTLHLQDHGKKRGSLALWLVLGAAVVLIPVLAVGAVIAWRVLRSPDAVAQVPPSEPPPRPSEPPPPVRVEEKRPDPPDDNEEERLRRALPKSFSFFRPQQLMREMERYFDLTVYLLRTQQWDKAETTFADWVKPRLDKPQLVVWLGEIGTAIVLAQRDQAARSNKLFVTLCNRPATPQGVGPKPMMHHVTLRPFVIDALDRNARAGDLPQELQQFRRALNDAPRPRGPNPERPS